MSTYHSTKTTTTFSLGLAAVAFPAVRALRTSSKDPDVALVQSALVRL